ncbi:MAG: hypothetical protein LC114_11015 [Bryobacterales bacterium]|nr:hypothetical protein [Bryobacterales bacterium]
MSLRFVSMRPRVLRPAFLLIVLSLLGFAQTPAPMNLSTLKQVLAIGEDVVPTNDVIARIKKEGVDFFLDADMKTELILSAAQGRRSEADTLRIIDSLADACLPCKERMEAPISASLAIRFLKEKVRSRDILKEIQKRGLTPEPVTPEDIVALREAGASEQMIRVMKPDAQPAIPDGFVALELAKSKTFDPNRPYGSFDIRARVDDSVEFLVTSDKAYFKVISGNPPVNAGSEISGILPWVPADAVIFALRQKSGRSKGASGEAIALSPYGYPAYQFKVTDEKGKDDRYHFEVAWQLKPFTLAELMKEVEELGASFPKMVADDVRLRGLQSVPSQEDYQALRAAGASDEILNTVAASIRSSNTPPR